MKHCATGTKRAEFALLMATRDCQAAAMTLRPGAASDERPSNEHPHSEQWLFVVSGTGEAVVGKKRGALRRVKLKKNSLVVIEKGELHQIRNTGRLNFYVPPAYDKQGEPRDA
jgi:mannose-6-phosphate isomerase-like protein (cupin superfamily)